MREFCDSISSYVSKQLKFSNISIYQKLNVVMSNKVYDLQYKCQLDDNVLVVAVCYFTQYLQTQQINKISAALNVFSTCAVLASKYIDDDSFQSEFFSDKLQIESETLSQLEMHVCLVLQYNFALEQNQLVNIQQQLDEILVNNSNTPKMSFLEE
ncbi:Cyclin [Hexamita inflata]|uniref:Cyclin n=1 Tax=Hexamita inflata TaxID=28002 RepID=A0AA86QPP9_9EUKA|nr:Cyclin [Hexamita inflata]